MRDLMYQGLGELQGAARYKWVGMAAAWAICLIGWAVVVVLPGKYEASATVFADTRTALAPVLQGLAIQQDVAAQLSLVQQSLLGERQLAKVLDGTSLGEEATDERSRLKLMNHLRDSIRVDAQLSGPWNQQSGSLYQISYRDPDRERSRKVVEILLEAFIGGTVGGKREDTAAAESFLEDQIAENEKRLRVAEQRLADFKKENVGTMPGAEGDYFTRLQAEIDANEKARADLAVALSRRDELNRQLRSGATAAAGSAGVVMRTPDGRPASTGDTAGRLAEARQRLADLQAIYTDRHPSVSAIREEIEDLERRRQQEIEALRAGDPDAVAATGAANNPVYQSIQLALNEVDVEIASLRGQVNLHERKISELRRLVKIVPEVEAELARLNRDYDVTKAQYLALMERLEQARLGQEAEETVSGVKLEVLEPPTASIEPVAPRRPLLTLAVFLAGLGAGAGLAWLLSRLNPVFNLERELEDATGRPVLGVVSLTSLNEHLAQERRGYLRFAVVAGALVLAFLLVFLTSQRVADLLA